MGNQLLGPRKIGVPMGEGMNLEQSREVAQRLRDRSGYLREHSEAADTIDSLVAAVERLTKVDVEPLGWLHKKYKHFQGSEGMSKTTAEAYANEQWDALFPASALAAEQAKVRELVKVMQFFVNHWYDDKDALAAIKKYGEQK
jgi:hypothetical protein